VLTRRGLGLLAAPLAALTGALSGGCRAVPDLPAVPRLPGIPGGPWRPVAGPPVARFEAQGAAAGGKLYLFGGFYNTRMDAATRSDAYDPATDSWTRIADLPEPLTHAPVVVDGKTLYILGGYVARHPGGSTAHVWKYDVEANAWSQAPDLPAPRGAGAAARVGRTLHFFGGTDRPAGQTDDVDQPDHFVLALDGGAARWERRAPLPHPRNHLAGLALGDRIYAIGGQRGHDEGTEAQSAVEVYDPAGDAWRAVAPLPLARGHIASSTFDVDGRIMVMGGSVDDGACCGAATAEVSLYDPEADLWVRLTPLPVPRKSPVAGLAGGRIVVATGNPGDATPTFATWALDSAGGWGTGPSLPVALGEVAGGVVGGTLFLVGEGSPATLAYDLATGVWADPGALARRPLAGHHHAAEVVDGRLYLLGGLDAGQGKVQIYDPQSNTWRLGADAPFSAGSCASAVIGGELYLAGGIVGDTTTSAVAKYDPRRDAWTPLAPMRQGRNHAAGATDGARLYVFGGRGAGSGEGNFVANGFADVQVYDPARDAWTSSEAGALAPLPQARGGMGRAVFYGGRFYVMGGETQNGQGATRAGVYHRVDVYDPRANTWSQGQPLRTARHGIFPLLVAGRIFVAGGGVKSGGSSSTVLEIYTPTP
jgi:N-acetylneuraminic acid mutarotase